MKLHNLKKILKKQTGLFSFNETIQNLERTQNFNNQKQQQI